jgi:hypothetical protein
MATEVQGRALTDPATDPDLVQVDRGVSLELGKAQWGVGNAAAAAQHLGQAGPEAAGEYAALLEEWSGRGAWGR